MLYGSQNPHGGDVYAEPVKLDFSANTNPFGTPPAILQAVQDCLCDVHRYPDPYCRKLVQRISEAEGVPKDYILCGNGAAELIYSFCEAAKPKHAVELAPTFSEYALGLKRVGVQPSRYILERDSEFEVGEAFLSYLEQEKPDVVFLCNPNNPTGKLLDPVFLEKVLQFCRKCHSLLFLDECFLDLTDHGQSLKGFLNDYPELIILKAFTKSYGMAGIRLGYCMSANWDLLTGMSCAVQPWNVSSLAQAAGVAALGQSQFLSRTKDLIRTERAWLQRQLESLGFWVCPSQANFLLFHGPKDLHQKLKEQKIAIRNCDNYHGLGTGWYRIAVKLHDENETLMQAMRQSLEGK